jgi:hypothetical protein
VREPSDRVVEFREPRYQYRTRPGQSVMWFVPNLTTNNCLA